MYEAHMHACIACQHYGGLEAYVPENFENLQSLHKIESESIFNGYSTFQVELHNKVTVHIHALAN